MTLLEAIQKAAGTYGEKPGVIQGDCSLSYHQVVCRAQELATVLQQAGVREGSFVCLRGDSSIEFVLVLLACVMTKAAVLPISSDVPEYEFTRMLGQLNPQFLLDTLSAEEESSDSLCKSTFCRIVPQEGSCSVLPEEMSQGGFIRFSSGTTGAAKGVCISLEQALARVNAVRQVGLLVPEDRILVLLPLPYHFVVSLFLFLTEGCTIVLPDASDLQAQYRALRSHQISTVYAAPFQLELIAETIGELGTLRHMMSTSMALLESTVSHVQCHTTVPIVQLLGNIETGLPFINLRLAEEDPTLLGEALPAFTISLRDSSGREVSDGEQGTVFMKGPGLFDCYLQPYVSSEQVCENGWFTTGDVLQKEPSGAYRFCGRNSTALNIAGHKVFPEEVESVLLDIESISMARVSAEPHSLFGNILTAELVTIPNAKASRVMDIKRFLRSRLPSYKVPAHIEFVESLPITKTGKVKRNRGKIHDN